MFEILLAVVAFFLWAVVHEAAHILAAHVLVGVRTCVIVPFPHRKDGRWYWARAEYVPKRQPTDRDLGFVALAPRLPDAVAVLLAPFLPWPLVILALGGWVDMAVGAIGVTEASDLRTGARGLNLSPWFLRLYIAIFLGIFGAVTCASI